MNWTRRRTATITTWGIVVTWVAIWVVALVTADQSPTLGWLVVPPLLWVVAARLVLHHWWSETAMNPVDPPGRVLMAVAAVLPERRREWGMAMVAELAGIEGRSARWRFALSCVRATLWPSSWSRPAGGWPVLALVTGAVAASVMAAGWASGQRCPA